MEERVVSADAEGIELRERARGILYSLEFDRALDDLGSSTFHIYFLASVSSRMLANRWPTQCMSRRAVRLTLPSPTA